MVAVREILQAFGAGFVCIPVSPAFPVEYVLRKSVFKKLLQRFSADFSPVFPGAIADTYYLPEGRYYAVPICYKRRRQKKIGLPLVLSLGFSVFSLSAVQQNMPLSAPANVTILASLPALSTLRYNNIAEMAADVPVLDITPAKNAAEPAFLPGRAQREDRLNSGAKGHSVLAQRSNRRPQLVNYDRHYAALAQDSAAAGFANALKSGAGQAYAVRFMPARANKTAMQTAMGFIPAPQQKAPPVLPVPQMLASLVNNDKPDILALGYAAIPANPLRESPFDSILTDNNKKDTGRFIPPIGKKDHSWAAQPLPASVFEPKQQKCLAEAVYFEARSESFKGQAAIAQIVLNRVRNPAYPDTVCGVVYQNVNWYNRCQFSFACDGKKHRVTELRPWHIAEAVAKAVSAGQIWLSDIGSATHYHAVYVHPYWAGFMDKTQKIGSHIFYRTRGGGWS